MIQRIQSVYLLLVICICAITACLPLAELISPDAYYQFTPLGIYTVGENTVLTYSTFSLFTLLIVTGLIALGEIFLYKNRILQMRMGSFSILLLIGYYVAWGYFLYTQKEILNASLHYKFASGLPMICIILEYLAIRSIGKDEALVRSLDRLR